MADEQPVTELLAAWHGGDPDAAEQLMPLVYDELRRIARRHMRRERADHTLQPTALVNEALSRLIQQEQIAWSDRRHFFAITARIMRRVLVDHARAQQADKRGGGTIMVALSDARVGELSATARPAELLALDECLARLDAMDPFKSAVVHLRYFAGLSIEETAEALDSSTATVNRHWRMAKAWLFRELHTMES